MILWVEEEHVIFLREMMRPLCKTICIEESYCNYLRKNLAFNKDKCSDFKKDSVLFSFKEENNLSDAQKKHYVLKYEYFVKMPMSIMKGATLFAMKT